MKKQKINIDRLFEKARYERPGIELEEIKSILQNSAVSNTISNMKFANKTGAMKMAALGTIATAGALSIALLATSPKLAQVVDQPAMINYSANKIAQNIEPTVSSENTVNTNDESVKEKQRDNKNTTTENESMVKPIELSDGELKDIGVNVQSNGKAVFYTIAGNGVVTMTTLCPEGVSVQTLDSAPNAVSLNPSIITDESGRSKFKINVGKIADNLNGTSSGMFFCSSFIFDSSERNMQSSIVMSFNITDSPNMNLSFNSNLNDDTFFSNSDTIVTSLSKTFDFDQFFADQREYNTRIFDLLNKNFSEEYSNLLDNQQIRAKILQNQNNPTLLRTNTNQNITFDTVDIVGSMSQFNMISPSINSGNINIKVDTNFDNNGNVVATFALSDYPDSSYQLAINSPKSPERIVVKVYSDDEAERLDSIQSSRIADEEDSLENISNRRDTVVHFYSQCPPNTRKIEKAPDFSFVNLTPIKVVTGIDDSHKRVYYIWVAPNENLIKLLPTATAETLGSELLALNEIKNSKVIGTENIAEKGKALKGGYLDVWNASEGVIGGFTVFPNPMTNRNATLKFKLSESRTASARVYDLKGAFVKELFHNLQFAPADINQEANLSGLSSGIYIIELTTEQGERVSQRVVVE